MVSMTVKRPEVGSRKERRARKAAERDANKKTVRFGTTLIVEMAMAKEQAIGPDPIYGNGPLADRQAASDAWKIMDQSFREAQGAALKKLIEKDPG